MPRLPAKQREAEKISTALPGGGYAASAHDVPSRSTWDGHAISLLKALPGDRKKRKQTVEKFVSLLASKREEFRREKKTGAGSTTEAIEFYRRVVEINATWKDEKESAQSAADSNSNNNNNSAKKGIKRGPDDNSSPQPRKRGRPPKRKLEEIEDGSPNSAHKNDSATDEDDFLKQHNDCCDVCTKGGELICCSTCNLVFHIDCVRPTMKSLPGDDWSCAHCHASGVTGLKKESKLRKRAAVAIREMAKKRQSIQEQNKDEESTLNDNDAASGRRQRRQPSLYDPQMCAAKEWQSDENNDSKNALDTTEDATSIEENDVNNENESDICFDSIPFGVLQKLSSKNRALGSGSKHGQFHCKYCMDDDTTLTCCFCACRICFGKHDKKSTILCDMCDGEYHFNCLSPPLKVVPVNDWFCPICRDAIKQAQKESEQVDVKKKITPSDNTPLKKMKQKKKQAKKSSTPVLEKKPFKQPRSSDGRFASTQPRTASGKFASKSTVATSNSNPTPPITMPVGNPVKRGPGRPPKTKATPPSISKQSVIESGLFVKRRPGRPPKAVTLMNLALAKIDAAKELGQAVQGSNDDGDQKRSRSGRVLKRNTAYDEIDDDSHLKSLLRSTMELNKGSLSSLYNENGDNTTTSVSSQLLAASLFLNAESNQLNLQNEHIAKAASAAMDQLPAAYKASLLLPKHDSEGASYHHSQNDSDMDSQALTLQQDPSQVNAIQSTSPNSAKTSNDLNLFSSSVDEGTQSSSKAPRRKPGARECMQISRRFGANIIPKNYMEILLDYCSRGKAEHLIRMRERLDEHSRYLELQLAGLEMMIQQRDEKNQVLTQVVDKNDVKSIVQSHDDVVPT